MLKLRQEYGPQRREPTTLRLRGCGSLLPISLLVTTDEFCFYKKGLHGSLLPPPTDETPRQSTLHGPVVRVGLLTGCFQHWGDPLKHHPDNLWDALRTLSQVERKGFRV